MIQKQHFVENIRQGYNPKGDFIYLGAGMLQNEVIPEAEVKISLKTLNRHGLIAGATGTGKTKSLQVLAENLSEKGVPVLLMDIKGDLSGLAKASNTESFILERHEKLNFPFKASPSPVEILSLSEQKGVRLRATVSEFGPLFISRILDLSPAQSGIIAVLFKYCDDQHLPLLDLQDLKKALQYVGNQNKQEFEESYGRISTASTGTILRKIVALEQEGADRFFGEPSFEVKDLLRTSTDGRGYINILRLDDIQDKPALFSTFMLSLLAEIYNSFPEQGDKDRPELVLFIDEAHLIFKQASPALLEQLENIVKLIRSKGVGIIFVTQNPTDIPAEILGQLGLKIQHALRAFTAKDRKDIKLTAENYPVSEFYDTKNELGSLGIGEAFITGLDEKGRPSPLVATHLRAPMSRMDVLSASEIKEITETSILAEKYNKEIDRNSAYEILTQKIEKADEEMAREKAEEERKKLTGRRSRDRQSTEPASQKAVIKVLTSATFIRGALGILNKLLK